MAKETEDQETDDDDDDATRELDQLLKETRPKHLVDGLATGVGSIVAAGIGAVGIAVLAPTVSAQAAYRDAGVVGAVSGGVTGAVLGLYHGTSRAVSGAALGAGQVWRGAVATPEAILEPHRGKWYNPNQGEWVTTRLQSVKHWIQTEPEFDEDILGARVVPEDRKEELLTASALKADRLGVKDMELYNLMGVEPDADQETIQRRYNILMRVLAPTRAGGDTPEAAEKKAEVAQAFMVLCSPELRKRYDKFGIEGVYSGPPTKSIVDPLELYSALYGMETLDDYIGRLSAASADSMGQDISKNLTPQEARLLQKRRVSRLALKLAKRLDELNVAQENSAVDEVMTLAEGGHAHKLIHLIGSCYAVASTKFLGSFNSKVGIPSVVDWSKARWLKLKETMALGTKEVTSIAEKLTENEVKNTVAYAYVGVDDSVEEAQIQEELYAALGKKVLHQIWMKTCLDVSNTLHEVTHMVLFDQDATAETRRNRAEALASLGKAFVAVGENHCDDAARDEQLALETIAFYAVLETLRYES